MKSGACLRFRSVHATTPRSTTRRSSGCWLPSAGPGRYLCSSRNRFLHRQAPELRAAGARLASLVPAKVRNGSPGMIEHPDDEPRTWRNIVLPHECGDFSALNAVLMTGNVPHKAPTTAFLRACEGIFVAA